MTQQRHCLYRFFDTDGELLYVGITMNPAARWPKHSKQKPWWCEVETISLETFGSRSEVLDAEREAIKTEHPRHNIVHAARIARPTAPPAWINWVCDECDGLIHNGDGALAVRHHEIDAHYEALAAWQARGDGLSVAHLMEYPSPAPWHVQHDACVEPDSSMYELAVEDVRTPAQLLAFTAHLMAKSWLEATNWDHLIYQVCSQLPSSTKGGG